MKLTPEQIATIDETLVLNGLIYDDIKLEVTDHIASEIESTMTEMDIVFDEALNIAFEKWEKQLKTESNLFWAPSWLKGPKLFIDKWVQESKKQFLYWLSISTLITFLTACLIMQYKSKMTLNIADQGYKILLTLSIIILLTGRYMVFKSKTETIYSYIFRGRFVSSVILLAIQIIGLEFYNSSIFMMNQEFVFSRLFHALFINIFCIIYPFSTFYFFYKHFQFERKLKLT